MQGDFEKSQGLPISMLCDRTTTNVASSQPGFIGFVPMPFFTQLVNIMPVLNDNIEVLKINLKNWKEYTETDEDKKVYLKKGEDEEMKQNT